MSDLLNQMENLVQTLIQQFTVFFACFYKSEEKNRLGGDYSSLAKQVRVVKPLGIREEKLVLVRSKMDTNCFIEGLYQRK